MTGITEPSVLIADSDGNNGPHHATSLLLSPVPVRDVLHFSSVQELSRVQIIAADGRLVLSQSAHGQRGNIQVSEIKAGTYLILGMHSDGSTVRQRFVKE